MAAEMAWRAAKAEIGTKAAAAAWVVAADAANLAAEAWDAAEMAWRAAKAEIGTKAAAAWVVAADAANLAAEAWDAAKAEHDRSIARRHLCTPKKSL